MIIYTIWIYYKDKELPHIRHIKASINDKLKIDENKNEYIITLENDMQTTNNNLYILLKKDEIDEIFIDKMRR